MSDTPDTTRPAGGKFGWEYFRFAVAALLFATAVVKIVNMAQILTGGGLLGTMPRLVAVTAFEAAAAVYLIVGNRCLAWLLTLTTFAIFVTSLEEELGFDPFTLSDEAFYPQTFAEFVAFYERYQPKA